jgi:hypothetical protein
MCHLVLDGLELIQLQVRVRDSEQVTGPCLLIDKDAFPLSHLLILDFEDAFAFEHDSQNETGSLIPWVVQLDQAVE